MEKISIIVPVYNVEDYIEECVESLIAQTYPEIEIILVDDGSTDRSGLLCEEYAGQYSNVLYYKKENGGPSEARNFGMKVATAPYVLFVDSDDMLAPDACEVLHHVLLENEADIAIGDLYRKHVRKTDKKIQIYKPDEALAEIIKERSFTTSPCGKLFKKALFREIEFPKGMLYEDFGTIYKLFLKSCRIAYIEYDLYFYRERENSITTQKFSVKKMDLFKMADEIDEYIKVQCPELMKASKNRRTRCAILFLKEIALSNGDYEKEVKQLLAYVKDDIFSYLGSHYRITGKLFGLASVVNYKAVVWMMRKLKHV